MSSTRIAAVAICAVAIASWGSAPATATVPANGLDQDPGAVGCLSAVIPGCAQSPSDWLDLASAVAVGPEHAFIASGNGDRVVVADRDPKTGALSATDGPQACVAANPAPGCQDGHDLIDPTDVALDPSQRFAYVSSVRSDSLTAFRVVDGKLTQLGADGCSRYRGSEFPDGLCQEAGVSMLMASDVEPAPDGRSVYVAARGAVGLDGGTLESKPEAINVFERDPVSGAIAKLAGEQGCLSSNGEAGCADADGIVGLRETSASPDGRHLVAVARGSEAVTTYRRDPATGALTQLQSNLHHCASASGSDGDCLEVPELAGPRSIAISPDSRSLYVSVVRAGGATAIVDLRRDPATGRLSEPPGAHCWGDVAGCLPAGAQDLGGEVIVTRDGDAVYASGPAGVTAFGRAASGALQPVAGKHGCIAEIPLGLAQCAPGRGTGGAAGLALAPDDRGLYALGAWGGFEGVANLERAMPLSLAAPAASTSAAAGDSPSAGGTRRPR